jgi:hypothetical protein
MRKNFTMNIRKFIKESIERAMMQENEGQTITGADILNYFPFDKLPEDRQQVDWKNRGVNGWGEIHVPAIDGNGLSTMHGKDDVMSYLQQFSSKFGEEPMFVLNPSGLWFDKIKVINPKYTESKNAVSNAISQFGTEGD